MKIEKEKFRTYALGACLAAREIGMSASISGLAILGSTITINTLGFGRKHPFVAGLISGVLGSTASATIIANDKLQDMICGEAYEDADKLTTVFYGPSDEEEVTED